MDVTNSIDLTACVLGEEYQVTANHSPHFGTTNPWRVFGLYQGKPVEGKGRSPEAALKSWERTAKTMGDF